MRRTGVADLPLHGGRAPAWLFRRMTRLARALVLAMREDAPPEALLRRLSDPYWFQAFGCLLGFDWHSSGVTTTVCGALKEGLRGLEAEAGLFVAGGKGATSRRTPGEIERAGESLGRDPGALVYASRKGCGRPRAMPGCYHWLGAGVADFVADPHAAIVSPGRLRRELGGLRARHASCTRMARLRPRQAGEPRRCERGLQHQGSPRRAVPAREGTGIPPPGPVSASREMSGQGRGRLGAGSLEGRPGVMEIDPPRCTVCGKPVFPTAPTMFRSARYTTHPRCIRVPKPETNRRRAAAQAAGPDARRDVDDVAYLGALLSGVQVLVVAQRDVVGEALQRFFRSLGANALPAAAVERAIGLVQALRPEIVVCDISLLAFEDRSLARQLREHSGESAPIVLGIGATPAERAIADSAALDAFVPKPVGYRELAEALRSAARRRPDWMERQHDRLRRQRESLRAESDQYLLNAEVSRLKAQDAVAKAEKIAARAKARRSPFRDRGGRPARPRYRPRLLGY